MRLLRKSQKGAVLPIVVIASCIFVLLGVSLLEMAESEMVLAHKAIKETQAFHLAEAGAARFVAKAYNDEIEDINITTLGDGNYQVDTYFDESPSYAVITGTVGNFQKKIKVEISFLSPLYEHAVYSCNGSGQEWTLDLRGTGDPQSDWGSREVGGRDIINGDLHVNGDVALYGDSSINPAPDPNPHGLSGDVVATGDIDLYDNASISGDAQTNGEGCDVPDLPAMEYEVNNTHNVSHIFSNEGVGQGHLPADHELYNVVVKNPSDRSTECSTTTGDDYFLEPSSVSNSGTSSKDAKTPLNLGSGRIYYIDGNVWIHSPRTYGFLLEGNATIVATGNIYICDNTKYANDESLLGLVALGQYDSGGQLISGGNVYFGDPRFGTTYTVSAMMIAGNDFLYNTDSVTDETAEPETGFSVYGSFAAVNQVSIQRDWYDPDGSGDPRPAYFDPTASDDNDDDSERGRWRDLEDGSLLSTSEVNNLRHYQMKVDYDARVRNVATQPPGLPEGEGMIFAGITHWEQLTPDEES